VINPPPPPPPPSPTLQSISVTPQMMTVVAGLTQQYAATGTYSDGSSATLVGESWMTSNSMLATTSQSGLVTTLLQGMVTVTATLGTVSGTAQLTVGPPTPTSFAITPTSAKVFIGSAPKKLSAILTFSNGSTSDVSSTATWAVTNSLTASVDATGNVTPLRLGFTQVTATDGTFSATASFIVTTAPRYLYLTGEAASLAVKAIIDPSSGIPHMAGFIPSGLVDGNFPCPTTDPLNQFLYVGSWDSANQLPAGEVQIYSIDPASGNLSALAGSPFAFNPGGGCIDFEPTGKFGYAAIGVNSNTFLLTYSRDSVTGGLTLLNSQNLGGVPFREAIDPLGKYLYVDIFTNNFLSAAALGFSIDATTGALTPVPGASFALSDVSGTFTFHPSGNFLFMANSNGESIDTYSVSRATGALTPTSTIATCLNPTPLRFSPDGTFAYSTCGENSLHVPGTPTVESYSVGANGALTHLSSQPVLELASDITVDPSGSFLYISTTTPYLFESTLGANGEAGPVVSIGAQSNPSQNTVMIGGSAPVTYTPVTAYVTSSGDNTLTTYSVNSDGTLTVLQLPAMSTATSPFSLSLWPWGTDLAYASGVSSANFSVVPLSSAGVASPTQTLTTFGIPGGVVMDPAGQFAFEINSTDHNIYPYARGTSVSWNATGQNTQTNIGTGPIAMDPAGFLVFVANAGSGSISVYQNFGLSSELQVTSGSPFSVCTQPLFMTVDPFKPLLYVACSDQTLRVMKVDYFNLGALTQVASVQLGSLPTGLTVSPNGNFVYASESAGVSAFSVNGAGALTSVPLNSAISLANINGVYAEPSGRFVYVTTGTQTVPGAVFGFTVNSDGTLTAISAQPLATPKLPTSMAFLDSIH
jgi:6-phosphogluconolactonase